MLKCQQNANKCWHLNIHEQDKFHIQLSWAWKKFYNLKAWESTHFCQQERSFRSSLPLEHDQSGQIFWLISIFARYTYHVDSCTEQKLRIWCQYLAQFAMENRGRGWGTRLSKVFGYLLKSSHHVFCLWFHAWNFLYVTSPQKQVTDVSLVLKDSDTKSENLSSLIQLSISDCQKTDSSKDVSFIGIK